MFFISLLVIAVAGIALAQEETSTAEAVNLDENIQAEDLGISDPNI